MKRISWKNIYPWLGSQILIIGVWELKESEGGEAPPADLSQWTPGCEQWEGSLLAILWSILSLTRTFYSLVMWTLSMSEQITGQHFSPRSQWRGSTCKNVLKYYELREACFLRRWVSVYSGVCIVCGQLAIDWVKTGIRHSGIDQARPETDHWVSDTAEITQAGQGRCHCGPVMWLLWSIWYQWLVVTGIMITSVLADTDHHLSQSDDGARLWLAGWHTDWPLIGHHLPPVWALTSGDGNIAAPVNWADNLKIRTLLPDNFWWPPIFLSLRLTEDREERLWLTWILSYQDFCDSGKQFRFWVIVVSP